MMLLASGRYVRAKSQAHAKEGRVASYPAFFMTVQADPLVGRRFPLRGQWVPEIPTTGVATRVPNVVRRTAESLRARDVGASGEGPTPTWRVSGN